MKKIKIKPGSLVRLELYESGENFIGLVLCDKNEDGLDLSCPIYLPNIGKQEQIFKIFDCESFEKVMFVWKSEIKEIIQ